MFSNQLRKWNFNFILRQYLKLESLSNIHKAKEALDYRFGSIVQCEYIDWGFWSLVEGGTLRIRDPLFGYLILWFSVCLILLLIYDD